MGLANGHLADELPHAKQDNEHSVESLPLDLLASNISQDYVSNAVRIELLLAIFVLLNMRFELLLHELSDLIVAPFKMLGNATESLR